MEVATKNYPKNYPSDAVSILDTMSFTHGKGMTVIGSMSLRSQQYAGDYDVEDEVSLHNKTDEAALKQLARRFKEIVRNLLKMKNVFIGDIKSGEVEDWKVVSDGYYDVKTSRARVEELLKNKIITEEEAKDALEVLRPKNELVARATIKFHVVRWTVKQVLAGHQTLRDGRRFTLEDAFSSPAITKVDVIGLVQNNRYTEFGVVYVFKNNGHRLNPDTRNIRQSLVESMIEYRQQNNPFKALKREFAIAKFDNNTKEIEKLTPILNSDLGRLYSLVSDIGTLISLLELHKDAPLSMIRFELDQFKGRMANIYSLKDFIVGEDRLLRDLNKILETKSRKKLLLRLEKLQASMMRYLSHNTEELLEKTDSSSPRPI